MMIVVYFVNLCFKFCFRQDRENTSAAGNRAQRNRLLQSVPSGSVSPSGEKGCSDSIDYEPKSTIKELCRNVDAFIFVVDASLQQQISKSYKHVLIPCLNPPFFLNDNYLKG